MNKKIKILHLEDSQRDSELIHSMISDGGIRHDYFLVDNKKDFINILEAENIDIILADNNLPDYNGNEALKVATDKFSFIPFIFVSGTIDEDDAISAMENGATDYVLKTKLERLVPAIKRALHERETESKGKQAEINLREKIELIDEQNEKKEKRAAELIVANRELIFQNEEKGKRAAELIIAGKELSYQSEEKEKRAAELVIANKELFFQNREKEKRADELIIANKELAFQNEEKEKRAAELIIANKQLAFQNKEKEKRAAELIVANKELVFQNREKEKRADELITANKELAFQNKEKENRADELIIANNELLFQNEEKIKRADELIIANKELVFQNREKEKRADELFMANKELAFQNEEKEKRAAELVVANKELLFQNEEKEKRATELINAREKAVESDNLKSAFLHNLSHEIRTPMNQILGFAGFLKDQDLPKSQRDEYIDIINTQSNQLLHIITDIVEISEITTGQADLKLSAFNLVNLMDELFGYYKPIAEHRNLKLILNRKISDKDAMIKGDQVKLRHVFSHLIENAIKFTDTGSINIEYSRAGDRIVVAVKDTGIGIRDLEKQLIFNQFRQIEITLSRKYGGLGLGLSISNAYIRMMSGIITVESTPGEGSTFYVEIPYMPAIKAPDHILKVSQTRPVTGTDWHNETLLIADDEDSNVQFLKAVLRTTGIKFLFATNGLEAVEQCKIHPEIVVVLMDIKMPRMDGLEATKIIKTFHSDLPVIAITAFAMTSDREYILDAGCDDYIPKPFTREELVAKVQEFIGRRNLVSATICE